MILTALYIVRDPSPASTLRDICWETTPDRLGAYAAGAGYAVWHGEHTALYTDRGEAEADARARLAKR
jgi:hypothetical protein